MGLAFCMKCLEGTTERSDDNRVRSARWGIAKTMCLEGTTPQDMDNITGVLPSRQNTCNDFFRGLRPRLSSLRSVLPFRQLIRSAYSCGLFNLCVEVVFVMQMQIYNFVPIKCAYTENFKAAIFCFQGDIFSFLLESFHYPIRKFLLQSL